MNDSKTLTPAERMYKSHLKNVINYQKKNPEKMRLKYEKYMNKLKENPEKYEEHKQKAKERCRAFREKNKNTI